MTPMIRTTHFKAGDDIEAYLPVRAMGVTVGYSWQLLEKDSVGYEYALREESPFVTEQQVIYRHTNLRPAKGYRG